MTKDIISETFIDAFGQIERNQVNPFEGKAPFIPLSDDCDSEYGFQMEFLYPFVFFIEFDWFYTSIYDNEETCTLLRSETKEIDSIKVMDADGDEIEIDDVMRFRIENYLINVIEWAR